VFEAAEYLSQKLEKGETRRLFRGAEFDSESSLWPDGKSVVFAERTDDDRGRCRNLVAVRPATGNASNWSSTVPSHRPEAMTRFRGI
jgi:hypothetical protein